MNLIKPEDYPNELTSTLMYYYKSIKSVYSYSPTGYRELGYWYKITNDIKNDEKVDIKKCVRKMNKKNITKDYFYSSFEIKDNGLLDLIVMVLYPNTDKNIFGSVFKVYGIDNFRFKISKCSYDISYDNISHENIDLLMADSHTDHFEMFIERDNIPVVKIMVCLEESNKKDRSNKYAFFLENLLTDQTWTFKEWLSIDD